MQTATARVILDNTGSDVERSGITPAEALILKLAHQDKAGKLPFSSLTVTADVQRSGIEELARLRSRYPVKLTKKAFGESELPKLPEKFSDVFTSAELSQAAVGAAPVKPLVVPAPSEVGKGGAKVTETVKPS